MRASQSVATHEKAVFMHMLSKNHYIYRVWRIMTRNTL
jgi:hypothetical protein